MTLRVAILDDYQAVALQLADWASLGRNVVVTVFNAPFADEASAAVALADFDVLCLMRERLALPSSLIRRLLATSRPQRRRGSRCATPSGPIGNGNTRTRLGG